MSRPACALFASTIVGLFAACTELDDPIAKNAAESDRNKSPDTVCDNECEAPKVRICHLPPGNPQNALDICIGASAVQTHLDNHGDFVGSCNPARPPPPPPVCLPLGAPCTEDDQCCSDACTGEECFHRV